jgi:hypothetical protein
MPYVREPDEDRMRFPVMRGSQEYKVCNRGLLLSIRRGSSAKLSDFEVYIFITLVNLTF